MKKLAPALALCAIAYSGHAPAHAASLDVAPVLVEMLNSAPTAVVNIRNTGAKPIDVQSRVMRWTQTNGSETLEPSDDIVASPPITTLQPGVTYSVRLIRTKKDTPPSERGYRLLVDQLPEDARKGVGLVVRHAIPLFVAPSEPGSPNVRWSIVSERGKAMLRAENSGRRRLRLAQLNITGQGGKKASLGAGLVGYVLAGSAMQWPIPGGASGLGAGSRISANTDLGPLDAQVAR
jgi:fimbrial chaperone protein